MKRIFASLLALLIFTTAIILPTESSAKSWFFVKTGVTPFSPADVSGLKMWLDASDGANSYTNTGCTTPVASDGDSIKCLKDKSTNSYSPTEATNPPTHKTSVKNGLSVARFDGVNDILKGPSAMSNITTTTAYTQFYVLNVKSTGSSVDTAGSLYNNECIASENAGGDFNIPINNYPLVGATNYHSGNNELRKPILVNSWYILQVRHESGVLYAQINDEPETSITSLTTDSLAGVLNLGSDQGRTMFAEVDLGEVLSYNVAVGSTDRASILTYLNNKWNVYTANAYTPKSTYGVKLWVNDSSVTGSDGDAVGTLTDQSGRGNNFTQSVAGNKPTLKTNIKNGRQVVRFDGVDDYMDTSVNLNQIMTTTTGAGWVVVNVKAYNSNSANGYNNEAIFTDKTNGYFSLYGRSSSPLIGYESNGTNQATKTTAADTWYIVHFRHESSVIYISLNNGTEASTASGLSGGFNTVLRVGGNFDASLTLQMDLAEAVLSNEAPNSAEKTAIQSYLNGRWAVY